MGGMVTSMLKLLFLSVAIVVLSERLPLPSMGASAANIRGMSIRDIRSAMGDSGEGGEVTDALKYLDELDKYYSQVARPRDVTNIQRWRRTEPESRQRRVGQNMASAFEKLSQIKNYYNEAGRPRFGKRSSHPLDSILSHY